MMSFAPVFKGLLKRAIPPSIMVHKLGLKKSILFTFDDGPHPEITPRILDILDKYGAKSIFFIPGSRINRGPHLLREILTRNHIIGNHGYYHIPCSQLSYHQIAEDMAKCREAIFSHCGVVTKLYRPPHGIVNFPAIFAARKTGHRIIRWSLDSGEYSYLWNATSGEMAANFKSRVRDSEIILSHDDKDTVPGFLRQVLPQLIDQGYNLSSGKAFLDSSTADPKHVAIPTIPLPKEHTAILTGSLMSADHDPELMLPPGTTSTSAAEHADHVSSVAAR